MLKVVIKKTIVVTPSSLYSGSKRFWRNRTLLLFSFPYPIIVRIPTPHRKIIHGEGYCGATETRASE